MEMLFHHFGRFLTEYESRFEREYGFFRPIVKEVVERYLDCGNPRSGFARIRCPDCRRSFSRYLTSPRSRRYSIGMDRRGDSAPRAGIQHAVEKRKFLSFSQTSNCKGELSKCGEKTCLCCWGLAFF